MGKGCWHRWKRGYIFMLWNIPMTILMRGRYTSLEIFTRQCNKMREDMINIWVNMERKGVTGQIRLDWTGSQVKMRWLITLGSIIWSSKLYLQGDDLFYSYIFFIIMIRTARNIFRFSTFKVRNVFNNDILGEYSTSNISSFLQ